MRIPTLIFSLLIASCNHCDAFTEESIAQTVVNSIKGKLYQAYRSYIYPWWEPIPTGLKLAQKHPLKAVIVSGSLIQVGRKSKTAGGCMVGFLYALQRYRLACGRSQRDLYNQNQQLKQQIIDIARQNGVPEEEIEEQLNAGELDYIAQELVENIPGEDEPYDRRTCYRCRLRRKLPFICNCGVKYCMDCGKTMSEESCCICLQCNDYVDCIMEHIEYSENPFTVE